MLCNHTASKTSSRFVRFEGGRPKLEAHAELYRTAVFDEIVSNLAVVGNAQVNALLVGKVKSRRQLPDRCQKGLSPYRDRLLVDVPANVEVTFPVLDTKFPVLFI